MSIEIIKDCPFCGNTAKKEMEPISAFVRLFTVECQKCGARTKICDTEKNAIEKWNKRVGN